METRSLSQDDIQDVMEISQKIESYIYKSVKEVDFNIALSCLMSSFINCLLRQCCCEEEAIHYRNLFVKILDNAIESFPSAE